MKIYTNNQLKIQPSQILTQALEESDKPAYTANCYCLKPNLDSNTLALAIKNGAALIFNPPEGAKQFALLEDRNEYKEHFADLLTNTSEQKDIMLDPSFQYLVEHCRKDNHDIRINLKFAIRKTERFLSNPLTTLSEENYIHLIANGRLYCENGDYGQNNSTTKHKAASAPAFPTLLTYYCVRYRDACHAASEQNTQPEQKLLSKENYLEIIEALLDQGADPRLDDGHGVTALSICANDSDLCKLMSEKTQTPGTETDEALAKLLGAAGHFTSQPSNSTASLNSIGMQLSSSMSFTD